MAQQVRAPHSAKPDDSELLNWNPQLKHSQKLSSDLCLYDHTIYTHNNNNKFKKLNVMAHAFNPSTVGRDR